MRAPKAELVPLVADLYALGYSASDIAMALQRSQQRISAVLRDLGLVRPRLKSIDDLPPHFRDRVVAFRLCSTTEATL